MKVAKILAILIVLFLYSCGGGGGGSSSVTPISVSETVNFSIDNTTSNVISESNPPRNITFNFNVDTEAPSYDVDLYLSRNNNIDNNTDDYNFYSTTITNRRGIAQIVLDNGSVGYENLMNYYGGKFYVKIKVSTSSSSSWAVSDKPLILKKLWTFAVYMDADNSLNGADNENLEQMEQVGSNRYVNIVVQHDGLYTPVERYFVKSSGLIDLQKLGELDMAKVTTLEDFGKWIKDNFPADHYFIVIWDHGLGFERSIFNRQSRDLLEDDNGTSGPVDLMSVPDFANALDNVSKTLGKKIDIVGIDACLMNMVEVAYQIRNSADILVGSENNEPFDGWPYDEILSYLVNNANASLQSISQEVVKDYVAYYDSSYQPTQSAIDLSKIDNLTISVNSLAEALLNNWNNDTVVDTIKGSIFNGVQRFLVSSSYNDYSYADLGDLAKLIYQNDNMTSDIKQAALDVLDNLTDTVIANGYSGFDNGTVNGLTIWFPNTTIFDEQIGHYEQLEFAKDTEWDEFLDNLTQ